MASDAEPYLSIVVTARNDDHGGNLLARMQAFVSGWIAQARAHAIPSELIIVEWNPPADRPPLRDALRWPGDTSPCTVRFIEVPPELHQRYAHAKALPLYQMIAKNVGIRRARGQYILATNIDILFSSELAAFFAARKLERGRMYRVDRHDVQNEVPVDAPIEQQLAYCCSNLIRVNAQDGTFPLTPDGRRALSPDDLIPKDAGMAFGAGWFHLERYQRQEPFRWSGPNAELLLEEGPEPAVLRMDIEPGPGTGGEPLQLEILDDAGQRLADVQVGRRCQLELPLRSPVPRKILLVTRNGGHVLSVDPRELDFRIFQLDCARGAKLASVVLRPVGLKTRMRTLWGAFDHVIERLATGEERVALTVPVSTRMRNVFRRYLKIRAAGEPAPAAVRRPDSPLFLHTNGCGDFTLLAREHWFDLRAYPEFDLFSMNLDSVFCIAAHHGGARETILEDPMRIYHIEHGTGSGWTPEGQAKLFARIDASGIPRLENDDVLRWASQMKWLDSPMIFNHANWGLADYELKETVV